MGEGSMDGVVCWVNNDVCSLCLVKCVFGRLLLHARACIRIQFLAVSLHIKSNSPTQPSCAILALTNDRVANENRNFPLPRHRLTGCRRTRQPVEHSSPS